MPDPLDALRLPAVPAEPRPESAAALLRRIGGTAEPPASQPTAMRYFVTGLDAAVAFYLDLPGSEEELRPSPAFAMLCRGAYHERPTGHAHTPRPGNRPT